MLGDGLRIGALNQAAHLWQGGQGSCCSRCAVKTFLDMSLSAAGARAQLFGQASCSNSPHIACEPRKSDRFLACSSAHPRPHLGAPVAKNLHGPLAPRLALLLAGRKVLAAANEEDRGAQDDTVRHRTGFDTRGQSGWILKPGLAPCQKGSTWA